jgi:hypothetical protein
VIKMLPDTLPTIMIFFKIFLSTRSVALRMAIQVRVSDPMGTGMGMIFYPRVTPVSDPNQDGYVTGIFSHPRVTRRVPILYNCTLFYFIFIWFIRRSINRIVLLSSIYDYSLDARWNLTCLASQIWFIRRVHYNYKSING